MNSTVKRTIFGALFLAVMLGGLLFYEFLYVILFAFITGVMLFEFYRMTMGAAFRGLQRAAIFVGVFIFLAANYYYAIGRHLGTFVSFSIIGVLYLMVRSILQKDTRTSSRRVICMPVWCTSPCRLRCPTPWSSAAGNSAAC